jgi:hypothetical protein
MPEPCLAWLTLVLLRDPDCIGITDKALYTWHGTTESGTGARDIAFGDVPLDK